VRERLLGVSLSVQALDTSVAAAAGEVSAGAGAAGRASCAGASADDPGGAGRWPRGPMVPASPAAPAGRLRKGQQRGKKQTAVGTGLSPIAPDRRTPPAGVAALRQDPGHPEAATCPPAVGQARRATLEGKAVAMTRLGQRVTPREGPQLQPRVARTDGAEAVQPQGVTHVPAHTLVREILHAPASRWDTANLRRGDTPPHRTGWVRSALQPLVAGQTEVGLAALEAAAIPRTRRPNGGPYGIPSAMTGAPARRGAMPRTGPRAGRWARPSSKAPAGIGCTIAWHRRGCAGPQPVRRRCSPCGPYGSRDLAIVIGRCIGTRHLNGALTALRRRQSKRKASCWSGRRDEPRFHGCWSHSNESSPRWPHISKKTACTPDVRPFLSFPSHL
jgi:hypothetical protein